MVRVHPSWRPNWRSIFGGDETTGAPSNICSTQERTRNGAVRIRKPSAILRTALALLTTLPETPERAQQELTLHLARGPALAIMRGDAAPEVEQAYRRAQALCRQLGESAESLLVLHGLWAGSNARLEIRQARDSRGGVSRPGPATARRGCPGGGASGR